MPTLSNLAVRDIETVLHPNTNLATLPQVGPADPGARPGLLGL